MKAPRPHNLEPMHNLLHGRVREQVLVENDLVLVFHVGAMPAEHPFHARVQEEDERLGGEDSLPKGNKT